MALYKRGNTWWINITHCGKRIQRTTGTEDKIAAQQYHDKFKAELWKVDRLQEKPRRTWKEAVIRWFAEMQHKRSLYDDKLHAKWLDTHLGNLFLIEITKDKLEEIAMIKEAGDVQPREHGEKRCKGAGIKNFRWHDLRHTWASWHVQSGTTLQELQILGGWSTFDMVLRYAHLSSDHLKNAAERISMLKNGLSDPLLAEVKL